MATIAKQARQDAAEFALAKMYYGEGANIRRRLINETVTAKGARNPDYARLFHKELARQDMASVAKKARRQRERKDVGRALSRNSRGLMVGNYTTVNTSVLVIIAGAYVLHKNGLDVQMYEAGKKRVREFREKRAARSAPSQGATVHPHPTVYRAN